MGLDLAMLIFEVEDRFEITLPEAEDDAVSTVGDFTNAICRCLEAEGRSMPEDRVFVRLRAILMIKHRIPKDDIVREASIVEDLGLD